MSIFKGATVLITGATGAVGSCIVQALCKTGHTIRTFSLDKPHGGRQTRLRPRATPWHATDSDGWWLWTVDCRRKDRGRPANHARGHAHVPA
ncbi:MAG: hypothetical protein ABIH24_10595 [Verrucomicrobiota bacterium]